MQVRENSAHRESWIIATRPLLMLEFIIVHGNCHVVLLIEKIILNGFTFKSA